MVSAGRPLLNEITVNGIDVTIYCRPSACKDGDVDNEPTTFVLSMVKDAENVLGTLRRDTMIGKSVFWRRGVSAVTEEKVFKGEVTNFGIDGRIVTLECKDMMWRAVKKIHTNVYQATDDTAGNPRLIYYDMMTVAGVPCDLAYLQDPGAEYTINKFTVDTAQVKERADRLVKTLPNWRHYYDPQVDSARLEVVKYEDSGLTLTVGSDILNLPKWKNEGEQLVQTLTIRGATESALTEQTFSGDASTTQFTLQEEPETIKILVSGVEKVLGVNGVTPAADYDYYVDKKAKKIIFLTAPASAANNIVITYTYRQERPVTVTNPGSIAKYSRQGTEEYPYEDVTHTFDALDIDDARLYGEGILSQDSEVSPVTQLNVKGYVGLRRNMKITVVDTKSGVNEVMYIRSIEKRYPYDFDIVSVNRRAPDELTAIGNMYNRVKRLEEATSNGKKTLFVTKPVGRTVGVGKRYFRKRSRTWTPSYGGFYVGHPVYGVVGTSPIDAEDYGTAWYKLKASADDEYAAFNGTPTGITYAPKNGLLSAVFNGTTSVIDLPASNTLITNNSLWSFAIRFNFDTVTNNMRVINFATTAGNTAARLHVTGGLLAFSYRNGGGTLVDAYTQSISANTWYHAVFTYDGTSFKAYMNGVLVDTEVATFNGFSTGLAYIGDFSGAVKFDGNICDARIYDGRALDADEVTALYNAGIPREDNELYFSAWGIDTMFPANDVFREYFKDTEFVQDGYTTATVNTTTKDATASGGTKTLSLGPIAKGPTVTRVKVSLFFTGTLSAVTIGSDPSGATNEDMGVFVSGTSKTYTLATPVTELYLVITMASGAVISTQIDSNDVITDEAVRVTLDAYT